MDSNYLEPANRLTRTYREIGGQLRLSVTSYNGLAVLYSTHGTTYSSKIAAFSPLRELLSNVDGASGYWSTTNRTPSTGLPSSLLLPSGTTKQTFAYFSVHDVRAGKMSSSLLTGVGAATVYYDYNARGQRTRISGGESPSETGYDSLGRTITLSTFRNWSSWSVPGGADTTSWYYPNYLPLQLSKVYADAGGTTLQRRTVSYSYHKNGSLATRAWQRDPGDFSLLATGTGVQTAYNYDAYGRLQMIDYPIASTTVAATPDVTFTYNPAGRVDTRTEAGQAYP